MIGGEYDAKTESITISNLTGHAEVRLEFNGVEEFPVVKIFFTAKFGLLKLILCFSRAISIG